MSASQFDLQMTVNGTARTTHTYPMARLLDVLREDIQLTGTKEGCGEGECGACAVLLNGELVNSCLVPAIQAQGAKVTTVEGLEQNGELSPMQKSFLENGGAQCGMCTPGMLMASVALLKKCPQPNDEQIREGLAGNLCRCTGFTQIFDSVRRV